MRHLRFQNNNGSILIMTMMIISIVSISCLGLLQYSSYHYRHQFRRVTDNQGYYATENILLEGVQLIADQATKESIPQILGSYGAGGNKALALPHAVPSYLEQASLNIEEEDNGGSGENKRYCVTSSAMVGQHRTTLVAKVLYDPPSRVFDYEYFLNNWGWWWGSSITGNGDQRSNWDFDFKQSPTVNGHIYTNGNVESNLVPVDCFGGTPPFTGLAGNNPQQYVHIGTPRIKMPNLKDINYYKTISDGRVQQSGTTLIDKNHGFNVVDKTGIYLEGTDAAPIEVNGRVVIKGDCIIKGKVTGSGTLYVGGNLYIAGDLTYQNGPAFSQNPGMMSIDEQAQWVDENKDKDLVAFAAGESIYVGQVNADDWIESCYNSAMYGLKYVGDESQLGADGIISTPDDGKAYLDTNGDGTPDSAWYDVDGDGMQDLNYNYANQIQMNSNRISKIDRYPLDSSAEGDSAKDYGTVASSQTKKLEGVFYTNHAMAMKTSAGPDVIQGSLICRDEVILFANSLTFSYDARIHSRYQSDPNSIINLGLPVTERVRIIDRYEFATASVE